MFTGIIKETGKVAKMDKKSDGLYLSIESKICNLDGGASLAVNGVCLSALDVKGSVTAFRLMGETIERTNLGKLRTGETVNLEKPLVFSQPIDGHFVIGHVDGLVRVSDIREVGGDKIFTFQSPTDLIKYVVPKGSVALDGVSLTVVDVRDNSFTVSMMPYTLEKTLFGQVKTGYKSNLEVDVLGKYVERFLNLRNSG